MTAAQEKAPVPEPVLQEDRLDYTPTARSVTLCRRRAVRLVSEWGYPNHVAEAALLVSELATNALLHGCMRGRLFRVHLILTATTLRIEVSDPRGERLPTVREAEDDDCYGRGLLIVTRLADRWGIEPRTVGKTVFAELSLRRRADMTVGPRTRRTGPPHTPAAGATTPR
ncbi:ATP-binding protein [Streptomyces laculatispora]|uniref:ATP-binding protein n=1 Tax=Streptomyces laculatispora TaxID=887464 RepID=UPI001A950BD2|nr:ATP-binding protein [Streptomyces laculatispora]MBO0917195.1 ATP-binding protein [Streptomyces laculatispora]